MQHDARDGIEAARRNVQALFGLPTLGGRAQPALGARPVLQGGTRGETHLRGQPEERAPKYAFLSLEAVLDYRPPQDQIADWHTVVPGKRETFWSIAAEHQVPVEKIIAFNFPGSAENGRVVPAIVNWYLRRHRGFGCSMTQDHLNRKFRGGEKIAIPLLGAVTLGEPQIGRPEPLDEEAIVAGDLGRFDAVVMGIRAYNTRPRLMALHEPLMAYVAGGGRLVVQYNTNNRFDPLRGAIGPRPFQISRLRVTDETAPMVAVNPEHPALVGPNRLGPADFDGWVQERGLYFADQWDPAYEVLFAAHDPGEEPLQGGTLISHHGEGVFVYTGLSFFRQLPAGVPGAYRLLANLLALE